MLIWQVDICGIFFLESPSAILGALTFIIQYLTYTL